MPETADKDKTFPAVIVAGSAQRRREKGLELAKKMVCADPEHAPCGVCRHCRKVNQGIHPDVIPVERFMEEKDLGGEVKICPIRALRADAFIRPNEAERKVYLIDNAQNMNPNAQNALLKLLEEGPPYAAFLLLTDRAGALLETIRSRCVTVQAGEEAIPPERDENALALCRALCGGTELDRIALLTALEGTKPDRAGLERFLTDLEALLQEGAIGGVTGRFSTPEGQLLAAHRSRAWLLTMAERTRQARDMIAFHVGTGHLLGWLGVALGEAIEGEQI